MQRRDQALLLHNEGMSATEMAATLQVHVNTIYADLHTFDAEGVRAVYQSRSPGAPAQLTGGQTAAICGIADQSPQELGLCYGRWSLSKLRTYLIRQGIVKKISRKHLWRVLKKGGCASGGSSGSCSVPIPNVPAFWPVSGGAPDISRPMGSCSFSMSNPWS
jgi:transposase